MRKLFAKILFLSIIIFVFPLVSFAQVSKIIFTTEVQSIKPNVLSGPITIQTQDSGGNTLQTPETLDLEFVSTSATGEFLGSSGSAATKYMSKNTANRTFYYRDSAEGTFTITVNAKGRESGKEWTASQQMQISSGASTPASGEVLSANTESGTASPQSATSGSASPNYSAAASSLEVYAGADRLTSPGSPISFRAQIKKNSIPNSAVKLSWSFGDGNVGVGELVSHTYKYPGEYAVVLNAAGGDVSAVSRLKVKVAEAKISLTEKENYIEISNNSNYEINLFNWKIVSKGKGFIFQPDTIIFPHSSIKLDSALLKMRGETEQNIVLRNSLGQIVVGDILAQANEVQKQTYYLVERAIDAKLVSEISPAVYKISTESRGEVKGIRAEMAKIPEEAPSIQEESLIYEAPKSKGIFARAWQFLVGVLR